MSRRHATTWRERWGTMGIDATGNRVFIPRDPTLTVRVRWVPGHADTVTVAYDVDLAHEVRENLRANGLRR